MHTSWQTPNRSKTQVKKAVKQLLENNLSSKDKVEHLNTLANFRSSHSYPMQSMIGYFRQKAFEVDKKAVVVRRLKRIPSIINKLKRFPNMQISTMGDIGGIRIITKNLENVYTIRNKIIASRTRNKLLGEKNYLEEPKFSGYRGIHLIYGYQGQKEEYKSFRVELQIRSNIQHAWATAVEIVGTFLQENLKASQGNDDWLAFFKLVSQGFTDLEKNEEISSSYKKDIILKINDLKVFDILSSFTIAARHTDQADGFYLLTLDIENRRITARYFTLSFLQEAHDEYRRMEQKISEDTTKDVVLVSAKSLADLKKAYPNYFADTQLFIQTLNQLTNS
jgi:ppGpp synthetase/RelA/SpoT-type nucleotidyltranferase